VTDNSINIDIEDGLFNPTYLPYLEDVTPTQVYFGGSSAGKSQFIVGQRITWDLLKGGRNYLVVRKVGRTLDTSVFNQVKQGINDFKVRDLFHITQSPMRITNKVNGYQVLFGGLDDVEKLKSTLPEVGIITDIIVEEATEVDQDDIKQLEKRLRGRSKHPKRLTLLFNPILQTHWIFQDYFKGKFHEGDKLYKDDGLLILHTTYKDNLFLEPEDIKRLEDETSAYHYDVYTLGKWGVLGGVIFTKWSIADLSPMIPIFDNIKNGLDFGFAEDPAAYNRMHFDRMRKKLYIFDEMHEYGFTNPMIAEWLKPVVNNELVVCDSAEPKSIKELNEHGINAIGAKKGPDSVRYGIQFLQQLEVIIDRSCIETINEWQQYQWKKLRDGTTTNQPVDKNNHHIDNTRYALEDEMASLKATPRVAVMGKSKERDLRKEKPTNLKKGETAIPIYEGDIVVEWEILSNVTRKRGLRIPYSRRGILG